jgi:NADH:ubiquinone oxidoreductase subunit E
MNLEIESDEVIARIEPLLARYEGRQGILVPLLQDVQNEFGYLPEEAVRMLSERLNFSLAQVYGVASFYTQFYFEPRGRNLIRVCMGTACHIRGALGILERFEKALGIKEGETTQDMEFTLETVNCVGCCGLAPVIVFNERVVRKRGQRKLLAQLRSRGAPSS